MIFISPQKVLLAPSGPLRGESALSLVFTVVLVTDVLLQRDHRPVSLSGAVTEIFLKFGLGQHLIDRIEFLLAFHHNNLPACQSARQGSQLH